jgi:S1-C subfamily serine protease
MLRTAVALAPLFCLSVALAPPALAQPPPGSPRRTRQVEIIERSGASVVAIFTEAKDSRLGSGSGSIIHPDGYILTNDHVVEDRRGIVLVRDLPPLEFRTVGRLWEKDLALIKVEAPGPLVAVPLGRSDDLLAGEPILIGGNPGARGIVFSAGIISAPNLLLGASALTMTSFPGDSRDRFIQFDAASNPGNSGGPLINAEGRQIGVVARMIRDEQNINFAIPIDRAHRGFHDLLLPEERGDFWTGLELDLAGTGLRRVAEDSPAAAAGLREGDLITAVGDARVQNAVDYYVALGGRAANGRMTVKYLREGIPGEASLTLAPYPTPAGRPADGLKEGLHYRLYRGRFGRCPDFRRLTPVDQGTATRPALGAIAGLPDDDYALVLEGFVEVPETGVWTFLIGSDDGSRLYLHGDLVAECDGPHPLQFSGARLRLEKGVHPVRIEYFEATGNAELELSLCRDGSSHRQEPRCFVAGEE